MHNEVMMTKEELNRIVEPLLLWFHQNARKLPWREQPFPYYVWVSEIMLQQTRVEAVKPFFARFIETLPDPWALASCPEERLLKLWEGLGYYNRVRNMQKAAVRVVQEYDGKLPADYHELQKLPGIGSYTAGAIASIAYGIPAPAVDGNVLRVLSRIMESEADISRQSVKTEFEERVMEMIPSTCPGTFNQALMELGATVCLPNGQPECGRCPVAEWCLARIHGRTGEIPKKSMGKKRRIEEKTVLVIRDGLHTMIHRRPSKGLLAGLYELPNLEGHLSEEELLYYLKQEQIPAVRILPLPEAKHIFSHVEWHMVGYLILTEDLEALKEEKPEKGHWPFLVVEPERTEAEYPIPAAFAAYAKYLQIRLGQEKYRDPEEHTQKKSGEKGL